MNLSLNMCTMVMQLTHNTFYISLPKVKCVADICYLQLQPVESLSKYLTTLQRLAKYCNYKVVAETEHQDEMIRYASMQGFIRKIYTKTAGKAPILIVVNCFSIL